MSEECVCVCVLNIAHNTERLKLHSMNPVLQI